MAVRLNVFKNDFTGASGMYGWVSHLNTTSGCIEIVDQVYRKQSNMSNNHPSTFLFYYNLKFDHATDCLAIFDLDNIDMLQRSSFLL